MELKFENILKNFLEKNNEPQPSNYNTLQQDEANPAYFLNSKNIQKVLNHMDGYDLEKPNSMSINNMETPPIATTYRDNYSKEGNKKAIMFNADNASGIDNVVNSRFQDSPQVKPYALQGMYEHELGHARDPRLKKTGNNLGFLIQAALSGDQASRELPAWKSEDDYWQGLKGKI